ncbi:SoxR reducing system RseC family protein [Thalassotalea piscium]|uniref:Sigma-E factor negative regulatory protein RseC n=1 Tax=Thalassotalea piscium TaxID=1230533 RepID=A0A7X0TT21_9GAMM|nr:SoxR reducing system RseC family protein [Thalassotalea piscium]MBB6542699.1 sigma-E factor negative regulatory protein RseC [Thalassotalea piscium]
MIEEIAQVTAVSNNHQVTVVTEVKSTCGSCQQVDTCGSGQVAKAFPQKNLTLNLTCHLPVKVGDNIVLGLSEKMMLSSAWQVYCWPLFGLLLCSFLGQLLVEQQIFAHELLAITFGIAGGYMGFVLARYFQHQSKRQQALAPIVIRIEPKNIPIIEITE